MRFNLQNLLTSIQNSKRIPNRKEGQHLVILVALSLGYFIYGWMISYTSPIEEELLNNGTFNIFTFSIFSSLTLYGLSSLITCPLAKRWSCKSALIVSTLFGGTGWLLIVVGNDIYSMIAGRILTGIHVGTCLGLSMLYLSEISNQNQLKLYSTFLLLPANILLIFLYLFAIVLSFRWLAVIAMGAVLLQAVLLLFCPQSPTWLVYVGLDTGAHESLLTIHGNTFEAETEICRIKSELSVAGRESTVRWIRGLFQWKTIRPILVVCALQAFKGCSGQAIYYSYAVSLFSKNLINPNMAVLPNPILLSVGCFISVLLSKRVSLKKLLMSSTAMQAVANLSFFLYFLLNDGNDECSRNFADISCVILSLWPIINISVYSLFYTVGWGTISWTIYADSFDPNYKEISAGIVTLCYTLVQAAVVFVFF